MEARSILSQLPQGSVIDLDDAARWVMGISRWHSDRAEWHAKRLRGIGGSEMGAVLRGVLKLRGEGGFSSLPAVVQSKLMKRLPTSQTAHMVRGTKLEHLARLAFMYRYKAIQDIAANDAVARAAPRKGYEWCVGNPDDFNLLQGKRYLNDFKVPSTYSPDIDYDYDVQLHHYSLQAKFAGVKVDGLLLTKLDLAPEIAASTVQKIDQMSDAQLHEMARSIATVDMPGFRVVSHVVEMKRDLLLDILDCGAYCWNDMVLKGIVPDMGPRELIDLDEAALISVGQYQHQYAMAKAGISHLESIVGDAQKKLASSLEGVAIKGKELPYPLVKIDTKTPDPELLIQAAIDQGATEAEIASDVRDYSVEALLEEIKRLNGDPEAEHLYQTKYDAKKATAYLTAAGDSVDNYLKPGLSIRMSTKAKDKELAGMLQRSAGDVFDRWLSDNSMTAEEDDGMEAVETVHEAASGTLQALYAQHTSDQGEVDHLLTKSPMKSVGMR